MSAEPLRGRRVLLGIGGGIAAYKSAELVRELGRRGAEVRVVLTAAGASFITPLTLQALSGNPVHQTLLDADSEAAMGHIELARWAELLLIAPATADLIARLAHGLADDLLTTTCLATEVPMVLAPAMNRVMWQATATRANCALLEQRGVQLWGPDAGEQACGEVGPGRMLEPVALADRVGRHWASGVLQGRRVLITAGPTREPLDPVRFLSNRSSGRMGFALARAAVAAGAEVTLVAGPVDLATPPGVRRVDVSSASDMLAAVLQAVPGQDLFIACAAVADYRPRRVEPHKIKKGSERLTLGLERTEDILATVAALDQRPFTLGFAAETRDLEQHARGKLERKGLDMIAANPVNQTGVGFDSDYNQIKLFWPGGGCDLGHGSKDGLATALVELAARRMGTGRQS